MVISNLLYIFIIILIKYLFYKRNQFISLLLNLKIINISFQKKKLLIK